MEPRPSLLTESLDLVWHYPRRYTGALVLGNLLVAIMVRNELFGRLLYLIVNTCFAKVREKSRPVYAYGYQFSLVMLTTLFCN